MNSEYIEGDESTFTHLGKTATVDALIKASKNNPVEYVPVDKFIWLLQYCTPNPNRINQADLNYPILFTIDKKYGYCILDGFHRFNKALRLHHGYIKAIEITKEQLQQLWKQ